MAEKAELIITTDVYDYNTLSHLKPDHQTAEAGMLVVNKVVVVTIMLCTHSSTGCPAHETSPQPSHGASNQSRAHIVRNNLPHKDKLS